MTKLTKFYNNSIIDSSENLYLYFKSGENKYAVKVQQVVEIIKLPLLDYPQKLANNAVGLLQYNNFTINVLDLRFYLNIRVTPYSVSNQVLVVKTDESIFGLIIDKADGIISLDSSKIEYLSSSNEDRIIEFMYKEQGETISVVSLGSLENILRQGVPSTDIDIPSLFPNDDDSRYVLLQRNQLIQEKSNINLAINAFSQDKYISFLLGESTYCINLEHIKEFLKNVAITKIPCDLDYISGVIAQRGDFISIVDAKKFFGLDSMEKQEALENKNNIIIVEYAGYKMGFLVDKIFSIINIPEEQIKKDYKGQNKYIFSEVIIEDKLFNILDIKNIFSDERFFIEES